MNHAMQSIVDTLSRLPMQPIEPEKDSLKNRALRQINRTAAEVTNTDLAESLGVPYNVIKNATFRLADEGVIKVRKDGGKSYFSRRVI